MVVILTGYDDFAYAQRAIRAGVTDYLLKPAGSDDLAHVLTGIRNRILSRNPGTEKKAVWDQIRRENLIELRAALFSSFLRGEMDGSAFHDRLEDLDVTLEKTPLRIMSVQFSRSARQHAGDPGEGRREVAHVQRLLRYLEGRRAGGLRFWVLQQEHSVLDVLISIEGDDGCDTIGGIKHVATSVESLLGYRLAVGVGRETASIETLAQSYYEARQVLLNLPVKSTERVVEYDSEFERFLATQLSHGYVPYPLDFETSILEAVLESDRDRCDELLQSLSQELRFRSVSLEYVRTTYVKLLVVIQTRTENLGEYPSTSGSTYKTLVDESRMRSNMEELDQWLACSPPASLSVN